MTVEPKFGQQVRCGLFSLQPWQKYGKEVSPSIIIMVYAKLKLTSW